MTTTSVPDAPASVPPLVQALVHLASQQSGLSAAVLMSHDRRPSVTYVRAAIYLVLRERTWTYVDISRAFSRDHATVFHGVKRAEAWVRVDPDFMDLVEPLRQLAVSHEHSAMKGALFARVQQRLWLLDQELAAGEALAAELASKLAVTRRLRTHLAVLLETGQRTRTREAASA